MNTVLKDLPRFVLDIVKHKFQRYDTLGDWYWQNQPSAADAKPEMRITSSRLRDKRSEVAILLHEFVEASLCYLDEIGPDLVDQFDFGFVQAQKDGVIEKGAEPGDHPDAPYHDFHLIATRIEKEFVHAIGMSWEEHEQNCAEIEK